MADMWLSLNDNGWFYVVGDLRLNIVVVTNNIRLRTIVNNYFRHWSLERYEFRFKPKPKIILNLLTESFLLVYHCARGRTKKNNHEELNFIPID